MRQTTPLSVLPWFACRKATRHTEMGEWWRCEFFGDSCAGSECILCSARTRTIPVWVRCRNYACIFHSNGVALMCWTCSSYAVSVIVAQQPTLISAWWCKFYSFFFFLSYVSFGVANDVVREYNGWGIRLCAPARCRRTTTENFCTHIIFHNSTSV